MTDKFVRKQYFVKRSLQTRYAFMFVIAIGIGLNIGIILTLLAPLLETKSPTFPLLYFVLVFSFIILVAAISILFTHKIAGPLYKMEKIFREIRDEKNLALRIHLRSGDELQELAGEANMLLDSLRTGLVAETQKARALTTYCDTLIQQLRDGDGQNKDALLQQLYAMRQQLQDMGVNYTLIADGETTLSL